MADSLFGGKGLEAGEAAAISEAAVREAVRRTRTTRPAGRAAAEAARQRLPGDAPKGTPKQQVRRVAVIYAAGRQAEAADLWAALGDVGQSIKTPLFLRAVLLEPVDGSSQSVLLAGKASVGGAIAALALLNERTAASFAAAFEKRHVKLLHVPPGNAHDRGTLIGVMSELLVLDPVAFAKSFGWGPEYR